jgi:hypothetical protein
VTILTNVSEESIASIFRTEELANIYQTTQQVVFENIEYHMKRKASCAGHVYFVCR